MKRILETVLVLLAFPLWFAAFLVIALAIRLAMGSPILFRSRRAGLGGIVFTCLKFRTMRVGPGTDAERLTGLGRFLRSTSLDELPQLFHVLSGKMALVGPRPLPEAYLPRYSQIQNRRHDVRPGITGWAQVNGRNAISWERKFELDVWYVEHRTLSLDLKILAITILKVISRRDIDQSAEVTMEEFRGAANAS